MSAAVLRKFMLLLPVLAVLLLAHCASPDSETNNASNAQVTPEQIRAVLETMQAESGNSAGKEYSAEQIKAAMREHIARRTRLGNPGVFEITDPRTSQVLQLKFQEIHDPVRTMGGGLYFACTNFETLGEPSKTYDLDFWLQPHNGELVVYQENVHKLPVREDNTWVQEPRYTFVDDEISLLR
jgi:hypothetical protein